MDKKKFFLLNKPRKKGILYMLFSRSMLILLLIVLELLLIAGAYDWLNTYITYFATVMKVLTVLIVLRLFCSEMDATSKLTWLFLIALFPVPGALFLLYTRRNRKLGVPQTKLIGQIQKSKDLIPQPQEVLDSLKEDTSGVVSLSHYLKLSGSHNIYANTEVKYFPLGEDKFAAMLEELKKAEKFIFLEYFIIDEGYMWGEILKILMEKAKAGVDVRVMYDGLCEISRLPGNYPELLKEVGIQAKPFTPLQPVISSSYNNRDHRKILVIDGKVAFNGGVNLADEYINVTHPLGHWKDTAVMLKGDAVKSFTAMFLEMWNAGEEEETDAGPFVFAPYDPPKHPSGYVMPYGSCPLDDDKNGETVYMDILGRAQSYVHIMTPYLILDGKMETALKYAAKRGVDVKLILPGIPDKKFAYALAKSHYHALLKAGVKIYEYMPGFVHAKVFVSDDCKGVVGTINLDYRSLYHHFECATFLYKTDCIRDMEEDYEKTLESCREITLESDKEEKLFYKVIGPLMKVFAPLM